MAVMPRPSGPFDLIKFLTNNRVQIVKHVQWVHYRSYLLILLNHVEFVQLHHIINFLYSFILFVT